MILTLSKPLDCGNKDFREELELSEPTVGQFDAASKETGLSSVTSLIGSPNGLPRNVTSKIGVRDAMKASKYYAGFMDESPETSTE